MNNEEEEKFKSIIERNENLYCNKDDVDFLINLVKKLEYIIHILI